MAFFKRKITRQCSRVVAEVLEPRIMYSADALGLFALLPPTVELGDTDTPLLPEVTKRPDPEKESVTFQATTDVIADVNHTDNPQEAGTKSTRSTNEIAFVDASLSESKKIVESLERSGISVVWIHEYQNGLDVISHSLNEQQDIDAIHVITHGDSDSLQLGRFQLDESTLARHRETISRWSDALSANADILVYGCEFGIDGGTSSMVGRLAEITGADIAASNDLTGHFMLGGDWQLETHHGAVDIETFDDEEFRSSWKSALPTTTIVVTEQLDNSDPYLSVTVSTLSANPTLREAMLAAQNSAGNFIISLATPGDYEISRFGIDDTGSRGDFDMTKTGAEDTITIVNSSGGNVAIRQTVFSRIFDVFDGTLIVNDVTLEGNSFGVKGGAIHVHAPGFLETNQTVFDSSDSGNAVGGAIYNEGTVTLTNSVFSNNEATQGAAIYSEAGSKSTIISTDFLNNQASDSGGAIRQQGGELSISASTFNANEALVNEGGAVYASNGAVVDIDATLFSGNKALGNDGSGFLPSGDGGGGAVYLEVTDASFDGVTFEANEAYDGGAVLVHQDAHRAAFTNVNFLDNRSEKAHQSGEHGGGGVSLSSDDVVFSNVTFETNMARDGGGVYIYAEAENTEFRNVTFSQNTATHDGGAIKSRSPFTVTHGTFYQNDAANKGGAIRAHSELTLGSSVFFENSVNGDFSLDNAEIDGSQDVTSLGFNFITRIDAGIFLSTTSDVFNLSDAAKATIQLGPLTDNAGYVATHPLLSGSALINMGSSDELGNLDARGVVRDSMPDVGAYESQASHEVLYWIDDIDRVLRADYTSPFVQTIVDSRPADGRSEPRDIDVDVVNGRVYWIEQGATNSSIVSSRLDGSDIQVFATSTDNFTSLALDVINDRLYVGYEGLTQVVHWFSIATTVAGAPTRFGDIETDHLRDLEVDPVSGRIFWTQGDIVANGAIGTSQADGTLDASVSYAGLLNGLAVNGIANPSRIAVLDSQALHLQEFDYALSTMGSGVAVAGESLDYNSSTADYAVASFNDQQIHVYDSSLNGLYTLSLASGRPEAISLGVVTNPPELLASAPIDVNENGIDLITTADLEVDNAGGGETLDDFIYTVRFTPEDPSNPGGTLAGIYRQDPFTLDWTRLGVDDTFTQQDIFDNRIEYRQMGQEKNANASDDRVDLAVRGLTGSYPMLIQLDVNITATDDLPQVEASGPWVVPENGSITLDDSRLLVSDGDLIDDADAIQFTILSTPSSPSAETDPEKIAGLYREVSPGNFTRLSVAQTFTQAEVSAGAIVYRQNGQEMNPNTADDQVQLTAMDTAGNSTGTINIAIAVTDEQDDPFIETIMDWTVDENGGIPIGSALLEIRDVDSVDTPDLIVFTVDAIPVHPGGETDSTKTAGLFRQVSPGVYKRIDIGQTFTQAELNAGDIFYRQQGQEKNPLASDDRVLLSVVDSAGNTVSIPEISVIIMEVDDIPVATSFDPWTVAENGELPVTNSLLTAEDDDIFDTPTGLTFTIVATPTPAVPIDASEELAGFYREDVASTAPDPFVRLNVGDNFTQQDIDNGLIVYRQNEQERLSATTPDVVELSLSDSDGTNASSPIYINIVVTPDDDLPIVETSAVSVLEAGTAIISSTNLSASDVESDDSQIHYYLDTASLMHGVIKDLTGTVRIEFSQQEIDDLHVFYEHAGDEPGLESLIFDVVAPDGGSVSASLDVIVDSVNDIPVLVNSPGAQTAVEGLNYSLSIDEAWWADPDFGDELHVEIRLVDGSAAGAELPLWLNHDELNKTLSGTPLNADVGTFDIRIVASDNAGAEALPLILSFEVQDINSAPTDLRLSSNSVAENEPGASIGIVTATELDAGDSVNYTVDDQRFTILAGELQLKPEISLNHELEGTIDLVITATDVSGATTSLPVSLMVSDENDEPQMVNSPNLPILTTGIPVQIPFDTFFDEDVNDSLKYSAVLDTQARDPLPAWLEFNERREFLVLDSTLIPDTLDVIVVADDSRGGRAELQLTLAFEPEPVAPEPVEPEPVAPEPVEPEPEPVEPEPSLSEAVPEVPELEIPIIAPASLVITAESQSTNDKSTSDTGANGSNTQGTRLTESVGDDLTNIEIEQVDLQSLITPLQESPKLELGLTANISFGRAATDLGNVDILGDIDIVELSELLDPAAQSMAGEYSNLVEALDKQRDEFAEVVSFRQKVVGSTATLTSGLSVGYVIWLIRGGTLLGSMLSALPAWRFVDPLPILGSLEDGDSDDDDSLETLIENSDSTEMDTTDDEKSDQSKAA